MRNYWLFFSNLILISALTVTSHSHHSLFKQYKSHWFILNNSNIAVRHCIFKFPILQNNETTNCTSDWQAQPKWYRFDWEFGRHKCVKSFCNQNAREATRMGPKKKMENTQPLCRCFNCLCTVCPSQYSLTESIR